METGETLNLTLATLHKGAEAFGEKLPPHRTHSPAFVDLLQYLKFGDADLTSKRE